MTTWRGAKQLTPSSGIITLNQKRSYGSRSAGIMAGSFKMAFQIMNKVSPNSKKNTNVFCIFNAKDSRENLTLATGRYAQEIQDLQALKWKSTDGEELQLRLFAAGGYAYLCLWNGLSGACDGDITSFMAYYREHVPQGTVPVKSCRTVHPALGLWAGLMGEQGLEQVLDLFNSISRTTCGVEDPVTVVSGY
ncbi:uncharacterized protein LOC144915234 [Branchiostoma floridae x Branchiostoma belcheri]